MNSSSRMFKRDRDERNLYILNVRDPEDMQTNSVYWRTGPDRFRNLEDNRSGGPENQWTYRTKLRKTEDIIWNGPEKT